MQKEMDSLLGTQEKLRQRNADLSGMLSQIQEKKVVIFTCSKYTKIWDSQTYDCHGPLWTSYNPVSIVEWFGISAV